VGGEACGVAVPLGVWKDGLVRDGVEYAVLVRRKRDVDGKEIG
jgi:hypothetical protein